MASGHLDIKSGKWIDDTEADDDKAFAAEQKQHAAPAVAATDVPGTPVDPGSPAAAMAGPAATPPGTSGPVAPPAPLSALEKAKLLQFVQSNAGNPTAVAAAREMLLRNAGAGPAPMGAPPPAPMPPVVQGPAVPAGLPMREIQVGNDGLARTPGASISDKAKLVQQMRARALQAQAGGG